MATLPLAILVVEDDDGVRETIFEALTETGFDVTTASTGIEAIALSEERKFDMMVTDIRLPGGLDGITVTQHVRARQPSLKCVFISGAQDPIICDPALDEFVTKPFRPFELIGCIWKVLRGNDPPPRLDVAR